MTATLRWFLEFLRKPEWVAAIALLIQAGILLLQALILRRHGETMEKHADVAKAQSETAELIGKALDQQGQILNQQTKIMDEQFKFQRAAMAQADRQQVFDSLLKLRNGLHMLIAKIEEPGMVNESRVAEQQRYTGTEISVTRSVWEGHVDKPKTKKSKAPVPVIPVLAKILDAYRERSGNPLAGVMFASEKGTPLNLNNVLNRMILPALGKAGVEWHGWHAFRRGLATNLHRLRVDDLTIQRILRHSNVAVTQACYIKSLPAESVAAMNLLESALAVECAQIPAPVVQ
jgi:hypothetical protein